MTAARYEARDGLGWIVIDNPPVNAASHAVRAGLAEAIGKAKADPAASAVVLACAGRTFVAGADIREFGKPIAPPSLPDILDAIEGLDKPVVAAIHGTALGGGFEIALACHARVLSKDASVGLPEVKLGIIPGAGGTQRLPRLVGVPAAIGMAATGRMVGAAEALKLGVADAVAEEDVLADAARLAKKLADMPPRRTRDLPVPPFDPAAADAATVAATGKARGQIAPKIAADMIRLTATTTFDDGISQERAAFLKLVTSDQAKAMRHAFFAEREVARVPRLEGVKPRTTERVAVIGAGTMGAGISVAVAAAGIPVAVVEMNEAAAEAGRARVAGLFDRMAKSGRLSPAQHAAAVAAHSIGVDFEAAVGAADVVIEAVFEDIEIKKALFRRIAPVAKAGATLATNTSYLDVDAIAAVTGRAEDVIGLHFFSPANIMKLVEVIEGAKSDPSAVATGVALGKRIGKIPVVCRVCDGFVGNRILGAYRAAQDILLENGGTPEGMDRALEAFGFAMGPYAVSDLAGLDIGFARRKSLAPTRDPKRRDGGTTLDRLAQMGRFGQKTGRGFYRYVEGKRVVDPEVTALIEEVAREQGVTRKPVDDDLVVRATRAVMANEGAKILAEGIVPRALDIDVVYLQGYGYPVWRGGPMFEADRVGLKQILADMREVSALAGPGFEPAALLVELAESGGAFASWTKRN
ncbi:MAG: enoyl-CoA hydratase/isomerase family protein [Rhizobiales bacterium]|nr:enoyl-CoA hydratase/isomerase family protein [Hyphomicrobiales bacterium]